LPYFISASKDTLSHREYTIEHREWQDLKTEQVSFAKQSK